MKPEVSFLEQYINPKGNKKRHKFFSESEQYALELITHFDGLKPGKLISERRPSESKDIQDFRQLIFKSKTKAFCDKIQNALMKIRKSHDWAIKYPESQDSKIAVKESLYQYMEKDFPRYSSFTNWYFQIGFKVYLTDTNAVCLWMPINRELNDNEYYKPYPFIFKSHQIVDYSDSQWYLLESEEKSIYTEKGNTYEGFKYYFVDAEGIYTIDQVNSNGDFTVDEFLHNLSYCPVQDFGGVVVKESLKHILRQSRIYGIVPSFDEAVREYSDLQAEVLQHIHSLLWAHAGQECKKCKGAGSIPKKDAAPIECTKCKGKGTIPINPYEYYEIPRARAGETQISGVPIGYVQKQIDIAELQDKRVRNHIEDGLSAINMEFLIDPPQLNQSGKAKEVDKDDMHTFFHVVAEDIVRFFDKGYSINTDYRYTGILYNAESRKQLLPMIPVPEKYDVLSENYLANEVKTLKEAGMSPCIITIAQKEFSNKKFFADDKAQEFCNAVLDLDPFASRSEDDILLQLTSGGISKENYTIHCNIEAFVTRAADENKDFFTKKLKEKKQIISDFAKEEVKKNSASGKVIQMNNQANGEAA